jgi:aminoglycoside 6'-N-acetyltransferase I
MPHHHTIRRATPADQQAWLELRQALWPDCSHDEHLAEINDTLAADGETALVAESLTGELLGFAEVSLRPFAVGCKSGPVGYLEGWYVRPHDRRRGVGRALVAAAEEWARNEGCTEMASDAVVENHTSQSAHRAIGYEDAGRLVCFRKLLRPEESRHGSAGDIPG